MKILELFAWSRCIGNVAEKLWHEVFSVDWTAYDKINLQIDIWNLKISDVPFIPDMIWASPDCTSYSIAWISHHRNWIEPKSDYAKKCDTVNQHWIWLIDQWLEINPNLVFFIENPQWMLKHMPFMQRFKMHTVWYCKYGSDVAKPTNIWTNSNTWIPREVCHNYKYNKEWNIIDRHCHHQSARRWTRTGTQWKKWSYNRSKIPNQLCEEVIKSIKLSDCQCEV